MEDVEGAGVPLKFKKLFNEYGKLNTGLSHLSFSAHHVGWAKLH